MNIVTKEEFNKRTNTNYPHNTFAEVYETNQKFVTMYVNDRTIDYKPEGRASIRRFLKEGKEIGLIDPQFSEDSMEFIGATEE